MCTCRLNWARITSWGWRDDWDDTALWTKNNIESLVYEWAGEETFCEIYTALQRHLTFGQCDILSYKSLFTFQVSSYLLDEMSHFPKVQHFRLIIKMMCFLLKNMEMLAQFSNSNYREIVKMFPQWTFSSHVCSRLINPWSAVVLIFLYKTWRPRGGFSI